MINKEIDFDKWWDNQGFIEDEDEDDYKPYARIAFLAGKTAFLSSMLHMLKEVVKEKDILFAVDDLIDASEEILNDLSEYNT